jgi:hypothetical protein
MAKSAQFGVSTVLVVAAVAAAAAFAVGRSGAFGGHSGEAIAVEAPARGADGVALGDPSALPPGHPPVPSGMTTDSLPPGHPPLAGEGSAATPPPASKATLVWTAPARWQKVPHPSSMRLATYRIPKADGDPEDPELSVTQAGGSIDANAERWLGQFGAEGAKTGQRSTKKVGSFDVTIVEVYGRYDGGMGNAAKEQERWGMLGAIVPTGDMPHFFKMTGPEKSVRAAKADFEALIGSVAVP